MQDILFCPGKKDDYLDGEEQICGYISPEEQHSRFLWVLGTYGRPQPADLGGQGEQRKSNGCLARPGKRIWINSAQPYQCGYGTIPYPPTHQGNDYQLLCRIQATVQYCPFHNPVAGPWKGNSYDNGGGSQEVSEQTSLQVARNPTKLHISRAIHQVWSVTTTLIISGWRVQGGKVQGRDDVQRLMKRSEMQASLQDHDTNGQLTHQWHKLKVRWSWRTSSGTHV